MLRYVDDIHRAIRSITRHWLFSVAVILLLGLGACVAIVMLSFAEAVLFRPLPVPRPGELVRVVQQLPRVGIMSSVPEAYYENLRARAEPFAFVFGETGEFDHFAVTSPLPAERVSVRGVTPDFFKSPGRATARRTLVRRQRFDTVISIRSGAVERAPLAASLRGDSKASCSGR